MNRQSSRGHQALFEGISHARAPGDEELVEVEHRLVGMRGRQFVGKSRQNVSYQ